MQTVDREHYHVILGHMRPKTCAALIPTHNSRRLFPAACSLPSKESRNGFRPSRPRPEWHHAWPYPGPAAQACAKASYRRFQHHDAEEALVLANRVIVFSDRPARVKADIRVDRPYPRHRGDPYLADLRRQILGLLGLDATW